MVARPRASEEADSAGRTSRATSGGNRAFPYIEGVDRAASILDSYAPMRASEVGRTDLLPAEAYPAHIAAINGLSGVVSVGRWGRWLYLERALESASVRGNLLFSAVILRTAAEELAALRTLQEFELALTRRSDSEPTDDDAFKSA